ncbi:MAG: cytochrome c biogenesis protein CcsA [Thermodesulfobacteriota bacterium]
MKYLIIITAALYAISFITALLGPPLKGRGYERLSRAALVGGLLLHTAALAVRSYEAGHAPMFSIYETLLFYSWCTILVSVIVILRYREHLTRLITTPLALTALIFAQFNESPPRPLTLILRTRWFETHVIASFAAYAFFTLSFAAALLYLWFRRTEEEVPQNEPIYRPDGTPVNHLRDLHDITNRGVLWGFFLFSFSMFTGAVWAYLAWGTYWLWEPKVLWSFIVWFYYAGAMHAYYVKEWRGRGLAIATVIGYIVVLFTYLGVGLLMKSSHNF